MGSISEWGDLSVTDYSQMGFRFHHLSIRKRYPQDTLCHRGKHRQTERQTKNTDKLQHIFLVPKGITTNFLFTVMMKGRTGSS